MRKIITISLPEETQLILKNRLSDYGFKGPSEYVQHLIQQDSDLISQDDLLAMAKAARKDYAKGTLQKYDSLADIK